MSRRFLSRLLHRFSMRYFVFLLALLIGILTGLIGMGAGSLAIAQVPLAETATPTHELRGVWLTNIDSDVLFSSRNLKRGLSRLRQMNFNTVYPTVLNGGYTLYPSAVEKAVSGFEIDPEPRLKNRDMLAEAVAEGHRQNLAVIPWLEFGFMLPGDTPLTQNHPDWIAQRSDGSEIWLEGGRIERRWLSPFHPQVQQYLTALVAELVTNYDVDGIQFDDHLGLPVAFGYDAYTTQLYQNEHNGKRPPQDENAPEWVRWRADKISQFVSQLFHTVKALKPDCVFSLSPNPHQFAYETYLQDWYRWERQGYIEELIVQVYRDDMPRFLSELNHRTVQNANQHIPTGIGILAGLKGRDVPMSQIAEQVKTVRGAGLDGVSFFFYETLGPRDRQFARLFPTTVPRPEISKT